MRKRKEAVSVRVGAEEYKYLKLRAHSHGQSITDAFASLVRKREKAEPMTFKIVRAIGPGPWEQYSVTADGGDEVCLGETLDAALEELGKFRVENGYDARRFRLQEEIEVVDLRDPLLPPVKIISGRGGDLTCKT